MDGNGRIARFLMNLMLASGGYSWIVITVEKRGEYMASLEKASVEQNISDFAKFITGLMQMGKSIILTTFRRKLFNFSKNLFQSSI